MISSFKRRSSLHLRCFRLSCSASSKTANSDGQLRVGGVAILQDGRAPDSPFLSRREGPPLTASPWLGPGPLSKRRGSPRTSTPPWPSCPELWEEFARSTSQRISGSDRRVARVFPRGKSWVRTGPAGFPQKRASASCKQDRVFARSDLGSPMVSRYDTLSAGGSFASPKPYIIWGT